MRPVRGPSRLPCPRSRTPADGRKRQDFEHRIQRPRLEAAGGPAAGVHGHPDDEREQQRRPDPPERGQRGRARRGAMSPAPVMAIAADGTQPTTAAVARAHRQDGQERPPDGEPGQDRAVDRRLAAAREGAGYERARGDRAGEQRARHDLAGGRCGRRLAGTGGRRVTISSWSLTASGAIRSVISSS
jgi:hypothetical protein